MKRKDAPAPAHRNFATGVWTWFSLFVVAEVLFTPLVEATHEADHRYVVLGYVNDGAGQPIARTPVRVVREKTGATYHVKTEADGFYLVIVHLHDEDLMDTLQVMANGATIRVRAWFDPVDIRDQRGTRVDFAGTRAEERREMLAETLADYLEK